MSNTYRWTGLTCLVAVLLVGCDSDEPSGGDDDEKAAAARSPTESPDRAERAEPEEVTDDAEPDEPAEADVDKEPDATVDESPDTEDSETSTAEVGELPCEAPVLWAARYPLDDIAEAYRQACDDGAPLFALTKHEPPEEWNFNCRAYEYAVRALRVWHGERLEDEQWREYFERQPWFRELPDRGMSEVARENFGLFERKLETCRREANVTAEERELVREWFEKAVDGKPPAAPVMMADGSEVEPEKFRETFARWREPVGDGEGSAYLDYTMRTPVRASDLEEDDWIHDHQPEAERRVTASTGLNANLTCQNGPGEGCEGYETLTFYLDGDGELVALHLTAAACPHVYVSDGGEWRPRGEILRSLTGESMARWQGLAIESPDRGSAEASTLRVRIAEEKAETTYLDALRVRLGDRRWRPAGCRNGGGPLCREDSERRVLERGDAVEVAFELPEGWDRRREHLELEAFGHYVPE